MKRFKDFLKYFILDIKGINIETNIVINKEINLTLLLDIPSISFESDIEEKV